MNPSPTLTAPSAQASDRRSALVVAVVLVLLAVLIGWAYLSRAQPSTVRVASANEPTASSEPVPLRDLSMLPVPKGMKGVATSDGIVAGFVPVEALMIETIDRDGGFGHNLVLGGEQTDIRGVDVVDEKGVPTGYLIEPIGFVDLATASDPDVVRTMVEEHEALEAKALAGLLEAPPGG